jgi:hypothetical protein
LISKSISIKECNYTGNIQRNPPLRRKGRTKIQKFRKTRKQLKPKMPLYSSKCIIT